VQPVDLDERPRAIRIWWAAVGLLLVGVGTVGIFVPGLPSTGFFVGAAWCFSRSSRRLERWLLGLPVVGPLVRDYRDGLGMPRRAKVVAVGLMWTAVSISAVTVRDHWWLSTLIVALGAVGTVVILWRVPTRERVLAGRATAKG
jgi:uncharacterized membrane protein YbaN (DUF454 family)